MPSGKNNKPFGKFGENLAVNLLKASGYEIVERNYRSKFGEIDIVAKEDNTLIFVEVKCRTSNKFGNPEEAVDYRKLNHIKRAGEYYSLTHPTLPKKLKIEVVSLVIRNGEVVSSKIIKVE